MSHLTADISSPYMCHVCCRVQKRLVSSQSDYTQLEQRHTVVTEERDQLKAYTRQLEQVNDNLERELRVVTENVAGFEAMLNEAYEKNALLEMEVDDKEKLQVMLQRLKDESRGEWKGVVGDCGWTASRWDGFGLVSEEQHTFSFFFKLYIGQL